MNDWKYQRRRRTRGDRCLVLNRPGLGGAAALCLTPAYADGGMLCGCGHRNGPGKRHKRRIIKRTLARQLREMVTGE